jgi:serine/threonine protein kinase
LGAGSFGVVRECMDRKTDRRFAVKSINKIPKNARPTPRYLLKIQTEVDAMQQLGGSLDAVFLQVGAAAEAAAVLTGAAYSCQQLSVGQQHHAACVQGSQHGMRPWLGRVGSFGTT